MPIDAGKTHSPSGASWAAIALAAISFLSNVSVEGSNVFLPLFAGEIGASNLEVGFIVASYGIAFLVSSFFFGRLSDTLGRIMFVRLGFGLAVAAYLIQIVTSSPMALLAARVFVGFCMGISSSALTAFAYESEGVVGRYISYGALGWVIAALLAAWLREVETLFVISAIAAAVSFLLSFTLRERRVTCIRVAVIPVDLLKANWRVYLAFLLRQIGAYSVWVIFPLFVTGLGADRSWVAVLSAINMGIQFIWTRFVEKFNAVTMFTAGLIASVVVFLLYSVATNYIQLIPIQVMLALTYGSLFVGGLSILLQRNTERGTVTGLYYSTNSLANAVGPFIGGAVSQAWGFTAVFYVAAGLMAAGLAASMGLKRKKA